MHVILIYLGIFCGIFVEGEMVMISSVIAAHHGHLNLWIVMAIGIAGTYSSDTFYFFLGRRKGKEWISKNHKLQSKYAVIDAKLDRYPILIFLIYRFMYGFRTITPLAIGASQTRTSKFLLLAALSTLIWAVTYGVVGYLFGEVLKSKLQHIEHIEKYVIGALLLVALFIIAVKLMKRRKNKESQNILPQ